MLKKYIEGTSSVLNLINPLFNIAHYIFFYQCPIDLDYETKINLVKGYKNRLHLILNKIKNDSKFIDVLQSKILYIRINH